MGRSFGLEVEILDAGEAKRRVPQLEVSDVIGAAWIASDGKTNPVDTARAFAMRRAARRRNDLSRTPRSAASCAKAIASLAW